MMSLKQFNYQSLNHLTLTAELVNKLTQIYELRGRLTNIDVQFKSVLDHLVDVAKVESTDASNRIEGVYTSNTRLKQLVHEKTHPHNRSEEEISGYRDVLTLIHENYRYIPVSENAILTLHKHLFAYTQSTWGGHFKDSDNQIITEYANGKHEVRFEPPAAYITPSLIKALCAAYNQAVKAETFSPLLLSGAFTFDFVSIHPFRGGNGRMSRLLMLLTMYQSGFDVGKYISIEHLIEQTKSYYYEALKQSSVNWHSNTNDYEPFLNYFLSIILQAYRNLNERIHIMDTQPISAEDLILKTLGQALKPLSKADLLALIPQYSETTIKRALTSLHRQQKIQMIGRSRGTKYVLSNLTTK